MSVMRCVGGDAQTAADSSSEFQLLPQIDRCNGWPTWNKREEPGVIFRASMLVPCIGGNVPFQSSESRLHSACGSAKTSGLELWKQRDGYASVYWNVKCVVHGIEKQACFIVAYPLLLHNIRAPLARSS